MALFLDAVLPASADSPKGWLQARTRLQHELEQAQARGLASKG